MMDYKTFKKNKQKKGGGGWVLIRIMHQAVFKGTKTIKIVNVGWVSGERETEKTNERFVFINKGNGTSTIPFFIQHSGKRIIKKKRN